MVHDPSLSMNQCHLYSQKLNNSAALCIEIGQYGRAIFSLTKALKLSRAQSDESMICTCRCKHCTMDGCISYTENSPPVSRIRQPGSTTLTNTLCDSTKCGYVYRRPIRIPPEPIEENHNMGRTLFLIITFNLGLAHHLSAITKSASLRKITKTSEDISRRSETNNDSIKVIRKALQLYEIADNWHTRIVASRPPTGQDCDTAACRLQSIRFQMILANNLSHIHYMSSNHAEQRVFLEHLLSTVMVAVEYQTRNKRDNINDDSSSISRSNSSWSSNNNENWTEDDSESVPTHRQADLCTTRNLEGFLMNASHLFLYRHCADAA